MNDCIFCKIVKKEIPADIVYENNDILSFLDINPATMGHVLIIPKEHYENIFDVPEDVLCKIIRAVKKISLALHKNNEGVNVVQSNKKVAGQFVDHIHFHVIPRNLNDGFFLKWPSLKYEDGEAGKIAESIKDNLK